FTGGTGRAGKATTAGLCGASRRVAGRVCQTHRLVRRLNGPYVAARLVLTTTPRHRFCLCEMGTAGPGTLAQYVQVVRPHIGVVTMVAGDHYTAFRSLDATALEKRVLIEALPPDGIAVLNADDPRVAAMQAFTRARVLTFGLAP